MASKQSSEYSVGSTTGLPSQSSSTGGCPLTFSGAALVPEPAVGTLPGASADAVAAGALAGSYSTWGSERYFDKLADPAVLRRYRP